MKKILLEVEVADDLDPADLQVVYRIEPGKTIEIGGIAMRILEAAQGPVGYLRARTSCADFTEGKLYPIKNLGGFIVIDNNSIERFIPHSFPRFDYMLKDREGR